MLVDFIGCWLIEVGCKWLFADMEPKAMIVRGRERRDRRREEQAVVERREAGEREKREAAEKAAATTTAVSEKKAPNGVRKTKG
jgi:manganese-transporting P-type ATPase